MEWLIELIKWLNLIDFNLISLIDWMIDLNDMPIYL